MNQIHYEYFRQVLAWRAALQPLFFTQYTWYRVFLKKVLHKREQKNAREIEDDLAEKLKFGTRTLTM